MSGITSVVEFTPTTFEQITVTSSATLLSGLLSGGIPSGAKHMMIYPETNDIRWRADGTNPTISVGLVMTANEQWVFEGQPTIFAAMKLIASGNTTVNVHFFK